MYDRAFFCIAAQTRNVIGFRVVETVSNEFGLNSRYVTFAGKESHFR